MEPQVMSWTDSIVAVAVAMAPTFVVLCFLFLTLLIPVMIVRLITDRGNY